MASTAKNSYPTKNSRMVFRNSRKMFLNLETIKKSPSQPVNGPDSRSNYGDPHDDFQEPSYNRE